MHGLNLSIEEPGYCIGGMMPGNVKKKDQLVDWKTVNLSQIAVFYKVRNSAFTGCICTLIIKDTNLSASSLTVTALINSETLCDPVPLVEFKKGSFNINIGILWIHLSKKFGLGPLCIEVEALSE